MSSPTHHLRSGDVPRDPWPKPKPHTDLYNPVEYNPQKPLRGHDNCTFDLYPHDGFLGHKFQNSDNRKKYYTAAEGRDGPLAIFTESSAGYAAQRTAEDAQTHDNRAELDDYLTHTFCIPKSPPCKLARASPSHDAPFDDVTGSSNDPSANGSGEDLNAVVGPRNDPSGEDLDGGEDLDQGWRHPCWWCFTDVPDQLVYITRDKSNIERALKLGLRVSFRSQFKDVVLRVREILHFNPGDRPLYVLEGGDVLEDCVSAYTAYLKRESKGSVLCCCKDINAVGAYVEVLAGLV
ncbi:hypothetical protein DFH06DRAFT_1335667 [Mycena polygramma]|nr:hypothetical protein DFH06DRAFT_1335667 [Mycena polygramma]